MTAARARGGNRGAPGAGAGPGAGKEPGMNRDAPGMPAATEAREEPGGSVKHLHTETELQDRPGRH